MAIGAVQPTVLDGLASAVSKAHRTTIVGRALALAALVELAGSTQADVVLVDPDLCAAGVLGLIGAFALLPSRLLLFGGENQIDGLSAALGKGIGGALDRMATSEQVIEAVHSVGGGETYVAPGLQQQLVHRMFVRSDTAVSRNLTPREREVLWLTAQSCTARQIAARLSLSVSTVKTHQRTAYEKLGVHNAAGAVTVALREGLIPMPEHGHVSGDRDGRLICSDEASLTDRTIAQPVGVGVWRPHSAGEAQVSGRVAFAAVRVRIVLCVVAAVMVAALAPFASRAADVTAAPTVSADSAARLADASVQREELPALRTADSQTFERADGLRETHLFSTPVNARGADGKLRPIDTSLTDDGSGALTEANGLDDVTVPRDLSGSFRVEKAGRWVSFSMQDASGKASVKDATATFAGAQTGLTAAFEAQTEGIKETLTLADATAPAQTTYRLDTSDGLVPRVADDGDLQFADADGTVRFVMPAPTVAEKGGDASTAHIAYDLSADHQTVSVQVEKAWLADPKRAFPVTVDPTLYDADTNNCVLTSGAGANTSQCSQHLLIGASSTPSAHVDRTLLTFDTSSIPKDSIVINARTNLWFSDATDTNSMPIDLYRVLGHSATSAATWNKYDGTNAWSTAGGDIPATPDGSMTQLNSYLGFIVSWGMAPLAQGWIDGSIPNHGMLLKEHDESVLHEFGFAYQGDSDPAKRPQLIIVYKAHQGGADQQRLETQQLTPSSSISVDVANGNALLSSKDGDLPGVGMDLAINRTYNTIDDAQGDYTFDNPSSGLIGQGWSLGIGGDVRLHRNWLDDSESLRAADGSWSRFDRDPANDSGGNYAFKTPAGVNATLVVHSDYSATLTYNASGTKYDFDSTDPYKRLTKITDKNGNHIDFAYGSYGPTSITDTHGRSLTVSYDPTSHLVSSIADGTGRTWQYGQSGGQMTTFTDPRGKITSYAYDAYGDLTKITDPRGYVTILSYDLSHAQNPVTAVRRVVDGTDTSVGPNDVTTSFDYTGAGGHACSATGVIGSTVETDPRGYKTTYCYDVHDHVIQTFDAAGNETRGSYTANSDVATLTSAGAQAGGLGASTTLSYNTNNALTDIVQNTSSSSSLHSTLAYDHSSLSDPVHGAAIGKWLPSTITTPRSASSQSSTDHATRLGYDANGNETSVGDSFATQNQVTITRNSLGQATDTYDADGNHTTYTYNPTSHDLTTITPPTPLGADTLTYDALHRLHSVQDGLGHTRTYTYDNDDHVTRVDYSDGSYVTFAYDDDGVLTGRTASVTAGGLDGATTYDHDKLNRLTADHLPTSKTTTYGYDKSSNLTSLQDAGGTVTYAYNNLNLLSSLTEPGGATAFHFTYDPDGNRKETDLPNGLIQCSNFDEAGRVTTLQSFPSTAAANCSVTRPLVSASLQKFDLGYNMSGPTNTELLQSLIDDKTTDVTAYTYDVLDRLTDAHTTVGPNAADFAYTYDGAGNRKTATTTIGSGTASTRYLAYNADNELCKFSSSSGPACGGSPGTGTPSYDANGNQLTDGSGRSSVFNIRDQVTSITPSGGSATAVVSRGTNQEDLAGVGGSEVVTNALGVASTAAGSSYYTRDNTGGLLAKRTSAGTPSATKYYLQDALGSVAALTSSTGSQTDPSSGKYVYDPYGNPRGTGPAEFGWQSAYRAPGGLIHFGYRYYDPYTGTWTQKDPLNQASDLTQADRYTYAGGDPVNDADPSGACLVNVLCGAQKAVSSHVIAAGYDAATNGIIDGAQGALGGYELGYESAVDDLPPAAASNIGFVSAGAGALSYGAYGATVGAVGGLVTGKRSYKVG